MRHDETRDNTTATEATIIEADAHADTRETETKVFENHQGDGPSGFDFAHDTKWSC